MLADPAVALLTSPWPGQRPPPRRCSSRDPACRRRSRPDDGLLQMQGPSLLKPRAVDGRTACGARAVTTEARSLGASVRVLQSSSSGRAETWTGDGSDPDPCRREPVHAFAPRRLAAGGCETGWGWPAGGPTTRRPATRPRPDVRARWTVPRAVGRVGGDRLQRVRCPTIAGTGPTGERPRPGPGQRARTGGASGVALDRAVRSSSAAHRTGGEDGVRPGRDGRGAADGGLEQRRRVRRVDTDQRVGRRGRRDGAPDGGRDRASVGLHPGVRVAAAAARGGDPVRRRGGSGRPRHRRAPRRSRPRTPALPSLHRAASPPGRWR